MEAPPQLAGFCIFCLLTEPCCPLPAACSGASEPDRGHTPLTRPLAAILRLWILRMGVLAQAAHTVGGCLMAEGWGSAIRCRRGQVLVTLSCCCADGHFPPALWLQGVTDPALITRCGLCFRTDHVARQGFRRGSRFWGHLGEQDGALPPARWALGDADHSRSPFLLTVWDDGPGMSCLHLRIIGGVGGHTCLFLRTGLMEAHMASSEPLDFQIPSQHQCLSACMLSCIQLFATPWTSPPGSIVHQIFQARILE